MTGLRAANLVIEELGFGSPVKILDVEEDEPHIAAGKQLAKTVLTGFESIGLKSPFL